jgi:hypothetical protein
MKQMEDMLKALWDSIQNLDMPLARMDKLSGLVGDLRESEYQAGRGKAKAQNGLMPTQ